MLVQVRRLLGPRTPLGVLVLRALQPARQHRRRASSTTCSARDFDTGSGGILSTVAGLALFLPGLAVGIRRLHDTDRSGWWILIGLIPIIGWILLIVWYCTDSKPDNQYGPNPKGAGAGHEGGYPPPPPPAYGSGQYGG